MVRHLFLVALGLALLPLRAAPEDKVKVAFVTNNPADFWTIVEKGAQAAAKKHGVELVFRMPDRGEAELQQEIVEELVKQGVKGIAVSVINPEEQTPDLKRVAAKTNLITVDNDATGSDRRTFVGTDNYEAGKVAGRLVKEAMPDGGTVVVTVGQITPRNARDRFQGVVDELAGEKGAKGPKLGKYTLYKGEAITDNASLATAEDVAADALEKLAGEKKVCFVGLWAYNAPAVLQAAKRKGALDRIKIVSFDEYPATLDAIDKGEVYGTVVQNPYQFGYRSIEVLAALAKAKDPDKVKLEARIDIPARIVTRAGGKDRLAAREFAADQRKLLGK